MSRRIRVAYCLDSFAIGGTELNAVRSAEALDPARFELHIFHLQTRGPLRERYERLGVRMVHLPIPNLYSSQTVKQGWRLAAMLRQASIDVVHSHDIYCNIFAVPWARLGSSSKVIASRRWGTRASRPELSALNRWSYRLAHRVLANSISVARLLTETDRVPLRKVVELPNFLSECAFKAASSAESQRRRDDWGVPPEAFVVGIVARLASVKNHAMLLRATASLDERFHVVCVGDGPLRAELLMLAATFGIASRVHFVGELQVHAGIYAAFDATVLCSRSEGFPNALIEAMAVARPVVATAVGGVPDAVADGRTGLLVANDDSVALATALSRLEASAVLRETLGAAATRFVRSTYHQDVVIGRLASLYDSLVATGAKAKGEPRHA